MGVKLQHDGTRWVLPGETLKGKRTILYDVHDAAAFRIHRAWKDNIVGYDNSPLRRPTKSFKQIVNLWHPNIYGSLDTRMGCRQYLANWLASDCGEEVDVMRAIMDQIPFVPETYITWTLVHYEKLMWICKSKQAPLDQLLPTYKERTIASPYDAIRNCVQP